MSANATQTQAPVALVAGRRYAVGLYRFTGPAADSGEIIAAKLFTPWPPNLGGFGGEPAVSQGKPAF